MFWDFTCYHNSRNSAACSVLRKQTRNPPQVSQWILIVIISFKSKLFEAVLVADLVLFCDYFFLTNSSFYYYHFVLFQESNSMFPHQNRKKMKENNRNKNTHTKASGSMGYLTISFLISSQWREYFSILLSNNHSHMPGTKGEKMQRSSREDISNFACTNGKMLLNKR